MNTQQMAQSILKTNPVFLDTETTGLGEDDQIIEISVINTQGRVMIDKLVKTQKECHPKALETHGISPEKIAEFGYDWTLIQPVLLSIFGCYPVAIFNASFDLRLIKQTCAEHGLPVPDCVHIDVMELANRHFNRHAIWDKERSQFRRLSLARCCELAGVEFEGKAHRALSDSKVTLALLQAMAAGIGISHQDASNDDVLVIDLEA